jgi:hypothetical protein
VSVEATAVGIRPPVIADADGALRALPALVGFLDRVGSSGIPHCAWKSNEHLDDALYGRTDLDLLVARESATAFRRLAADHDLKALGTHPGLALPGVEHYLGLDRASGRLFHLHVHFRIVLGEPFVKSYRVPLERELLAHTRELRGVRVPSAELELAVLAIRTLMKYRARDAVKDVLAIRSPGIPAPTHRELDWLRGQTTLESLRAVVDASAALPSQVILDFVALTGRRPRAGLGLIRLRAGARHAMAPFARRSAPAARLAYARAIAARAWRRRLRRGEPRLTPTSGGLGIALVGADGAGKSTIANETARWLSWKLETRVRYLGSKPPSRSARWSYSAFRVFRRVGRRATDRLGAGALPSRAAESLRDTALAAHHLAIARQRVAEHTRARRDTANGAIVLFDRFPLACAHELPGASLLDGPAAPPPGPNRLARALGRRERALYQGFTLPDALFVLDVDPAVAAGRKPDHDISVIAAKTQLTRRLLGLREVDGTTIRRIDAGRTLGAVMRDVKRELWRVL